MISKAWRYFLLLLGILSFAGVPDNIRTIGRWYNQFAAVMNLEIMKFIIPSAVAPGIMTF